MRKITKHYYTMTQEIKDNTERFKQLLRDTGRQGVDKVIDALEKLKFFKAPASANRHLNYEGGLLEHSLNVYDMAMHLREAVLQLRPGIKEKLTDDNIAIAALLHDVCKSDIYKQKEKFRKDSNDRWEKYMGYEVEYDRFPVGHGEKSVIMLLQLGLELKKEEILAIRWHMSAWELPQQSADARGNISAASSCYPLVGLIQSADQLATFILEKDGK